MSTQYNVVDIQNYNQQQQQQQQTDDGDSKLQQEGMVHIELNPLNSGGDPNNSNNTNPADPNAPVNANDILFTRVNTPKKEEEIETPEQRGGILALVLLLIIGFVFCLLGAALHFAKILFNISFLVNAFTVSFPSISFIVQIKEVFYEALERSKPIQDAYVVLQPIFDFVSKSVSDVDLEYQWRSESACGGAVKFLQLFAMLFFFVAIIFFLGTDVLYTLLIRGRRFKKKLRLLILMIGFDKLYDAFRTIFFIGMQLLGVLGLQIIRSAINDNPLTCGEKDADAYKWGRILSWIVLIVMIIPSVGMFVGGKAIFRFANKTRANNGIAKLFLIIFAAVKQLVFLTLGIWDRDAVESFEVTRKAAEYDDDDTDDDNQHESVVFLIARTRSLIWILFPGTVFLTKICELANQNIVFYQPPLAPATPKSLRIMKWLFNVAEAGSTIAMVFAPNTIIVYILSVIVGLSFLADVYGLSLKLIAKFRKKKPVAGAAGTNNRASTKLP